VNCIPSFMEIDKLVKSGRKAGLILNSVIGPIVLFNEALHPVLVRYNRTISSLWGHILNQLDTIPMLILHPILLCSHILFLVQPSHGEACFETEPTSS
jgi:hypothetical protein